LGDVLTVLKQENQNERYDTLIDLIVYLINVTPGLSAAPALSGVVELARCTVGTIATRKEKAYNNDPE
jgi:hypothetical protein